MNFERFEVCIVRSLDAVFIGEDQAGYDGIRRDVLMAQLK